MYTVINPVDKLKIEANDFVIANDRMLYAPFLTAVEKFCHESRVLLGGSVSVDLLMKPDHKLTRDQFSWDIYTSDAYIFAKKLADVLADVSSPHIPARTVSLQTNIKHREFTIYVYTRVLVRVYAMEKYRGVDIAKLASSHVNGIFTGLKLGSISPEMHLIQIYRNLYSPHAISMCMENLAMEQSLYSIMQPGTYSGGADYKRADKLIKVLSKDPNTVFIGAFAIRGDKSRLQIITNDADYIYKMLTKVITKSRLIKYALGIVGDFQLTKHTVYAVNGETQTAVLDIFNSAQFEMIPYVVNNGIKCGNAWVILRFLFIDIWILRMLSAMDAVSYQTKIDQGLRLINEVRTRAYSDIPATFQLDNYIGIYMDENIAKKQMIKETGDRYPNYYPAKKQYQGGNDNSNHNLNATAQPKWYHRNGGYHKNYPDQSHEQFKSMPIDLTLYPNDKRKIMIKITKDGGDIPAALQRYREHANATKWGANKSIEREIEKNKQFTSYAPIKPKTYLDIGCGSGTVLAAFKQQYGIETVYGADIEDTRTDKDASEFVLITPGQPIDLPDGSIDIITLFHVIHHMTDSVLDRLKDIARLLSPDGVFMFKDHDVTNKRSASNVDFEHFVYLVGETEKPIDSLMKDFGEDLPMSYYSASDVERMIVEAGMSILGKGNPYGLTSIYHLSCAK